MSGRVKVVVTGATGFVGRALVPALAAAGHEVTALTRATAHAVGLGASRVVECDLEDAATLAQILDGHDAIIHLAGEPLAARRWDARQKQRIRDSRVESTHAIVEALGSLAARPRTLITASGIDYYGYASGPLDDDEVTEADPPGESFLSRVCRDWEREGDAATALGVRVVHLRMGLVLARGGGALARMTTPFKLFAGGRSARASSGCRGSTATTRSPPTSPRSPTIATPGAINVVTESTRNAEFSAALGHALHRPSWLPVPAFALKTRGRRAGRVRSSTAAAPSPRSSARSASRGSTRRSTTRSPPRSDHSRSSSAWTIYFSR